MKHLAYLFLRLTVGTLMAGHGAQKLFGWFEGPGLKKTGGFMEALGIKPGTFWGPIAAIGEFTGGVLTALGFLSPLGPQNIMGAMLVAMRRAHWSKGVWNSAGGVEFPLTNYTVALALALTGPGRYSLDRLLGIRLPKWFVALSWLNHVAFVSAALFRPEVVQTVLDRVMGESKVYTEPSQDQPSEQPGDIVAEQRPIATESAEGKVEAGV